MRIGERITSGPFEGLRRGWYGAVEIDPPWNFASRSMKNQDRLAANHYSTMSLDEICALPVQDLLHRDSVVFLWVTDTHLEQAFTVIKAWKLKYKTVGFYWTKDNRTNSGKFKGMGFWSRANPEQVLCCYDDDDNQMLLATRGQPTRIGKSVAKLIEAERQEHSRKPAKARESIEELCEGPYLSLFSREQRRGWTTWGNETDKFSTGRTRTVQHARELLL